MDSRVDIIVPVYNEEGNFPLFYNHLLRHVHSNWWLLVMYDFPEDSTLRSAMPIAEKDKRVILILNPNRGVVEAIKTGIKHTVSEAVMMTAIDLLDDIKKIDAMAELFYEKKYAVVSPSRYMIGGERHAGTFLQKSLSRLAGVSLHYFVGMPITDATNGSKLFRKSFLDSLNIESTVGWSVALEIIVKAHIAGESMIEIPTVQRKRKFGESKFQILKWLPHYLRWYIFAIKHRFLNST